MGQENRLQNNITPLTAYELTTLHNRRMLQQSAHAAADPLKIETNQQWC
jgi:hypothetical protein